MTSRRRSLRSRSWRHDRRFLRQLDRARARLPGGRLPAARPDLPGALLMSWQASLQLVALVIALAIAAPLLGRYMAAVYGAGDEGSAPGDRVFGPIERVIYKAIRVDPRREQRWNVYT